MSDDLVTRMKRLRDETVWPHDDSAWPEWCAHIVEVEALQSKLASCQKELETAYEREHDSHNRCVSLHQYQDLQSRLDAALAELRQCYVDDGCNKEEIDYQLARFRVVERHEHRWVTDNFGPTKCELCGEVSE